MSDNTFNIDQLKIHIGKIGDTVLCRIENDTPNGSAITGEGISLISALENLTSAIRNTQLPDPVWQLEIIRHLFQPKGDARYSAERLAGEDVN